MLANALQDKKTFSGTTHHTDRGEIVHADNDASAPVPNLLVEHERPCFTLSLFNAFLPDNFGTESVSRTKPRRRMFVLDMRG